MTAEADCAERKVDVIRLPMRARALVVGGYVPFTALDYPGALAAVVFCQGCPWRCAYCHNPHLQPARTPGEPDWPRIRRRLADRQGLLDAVVFSGGEPTAQPGLGAAIDDVRALGFAVGLHTAGAYPRRLAAVLERVDWVGFDVKAPAAGYGIVTGVPDSGRAARASLDAVQRAGIAFEVRTTIHPALTPPHVLLQIAAELETRGVARWVLQRFRATGCASQALVDSSSPDSGLDDALIAALAARVPDVVVRG
jgi:pyruvate formate lyase activating enzyme